MKKFLLLSLCLLGLGEAKAQNIRHFYFEMLMDGSHELEDGSLVPIWGFATVDPETGAQPLPLPSPTLRVQEGDSVIVHVTNPSQEGHTIHWHGLDVDQANDGVPATSRYVLTGEGFSYHFRAKHAGNYIYHCHVVTTLHLMMGMYGSFIVERPDQRLFAGGPRYNREYHFLGSEMDQSWNEDNASTGGLNTIDTDRFLLNGLAGQQLFSESQSPIRLYPGDSVLLRLLNIGFDFHRYQFPAGVDAHVYTSDGRRLAEPFQTDSLLLYPGERYSVILSTADSIDEALISVSYHSMVHRGERGRNYIPINAATAPPAPEKAPSQERLLVWPNPSEKYFHIGGLIELEQWEVYNLHGQLVAQGQSSPVHCHHWQAGMYLLRAKGKQGWQQKRVLVGWSHHH